MMDALVLTCISYINPFLQPLFDNGRNLRPAPVVFVKKFFPVKMLFIFYNSRKLVLSAFFAQNFHVIIEKLQWHYFNQYFADCGNEHQTIDIDDVFKVLENTVADGLYVKG